MGERKKYTREFKVEALRLFNTSGKSGREIEADLGIGSGMLYRWRKQQEAEATEGLRAFPAMVIPGMKSLHGFAKSWRS